MFKADGRLLQVEYAQKASDHSTSILFTKKDRMSIFYDNKTNVLIKEQQKVFKTGDVYFCITGLSSDGLVVKRKIFGISAEYSIENNNSLPIEVLSTKVAEYLHSYAVDPKYRPFGVRVILLNNDKIISVETDGSSCEYSTLSVGYNSEKVKDYLTLKEYVQSDERLIKSITL